MMPIARLKASDDWFEEMSAPNYDTNTLRPLVFYERDIIAYMVIPSAVIELLYSIMA